MRSYLGAALPILCACTGNELERPARCEATAYGTVALDETHADVGFSANEVAQLLAAQTVSTANAIDGNLVDVHLQLISQATGEARLVTYTGDECPEGDVLQVDLTIVTHGTIAGFSASGTKKATVDAVGPSLAEITFAGSSTADFTAEVDEELSALVATMTDKASFSAPTSSWRWELGPAPSFGDDWSDLLHHVVGEVLIEHDGAESRHIVVWFDGSATTE